MQLRGSTMRRERAQPKRVRNIVLATRQREDPAPGNTGPRSPVVLNPRAQPFRNRYHRIARAARLPIPVPRPPYARRQQTSAARWGLNPPAPRSAPLPSYSFPYLASARYRTPKTYQTQRAFFVKRLPISVPRPPAARWGLNPPAPQSVPLPSSPFPYLASARYRTPSVKRLIIHQTPLAPANRNAPRYMFARTCLALASHSPEARYTPGSTQSARPGATGRD